MGRGFWEFFFFTIVCVNSLSAQMRGAGQYQTLELNGAYSTLPQSPLKIFQSDQQLRAGANSRILISASAARPSLLSLRQAEIDDRSFHSVNLPDSLRLSAKSLLYMKADASNDIVFTDESRTRIFYADASSGVPVVSSNYCSGFEKISDIHLAEINGATHRLIVADEKANRVYSYDIDFSSSTPCQDEQSYSITQPLWIRTPNVLAGTSTSVYVGSKSRNSLNVTRLQSDDMSVLTATSSLSNFSANSFGDVFVHPRTDELFVSVRRASFSNNGGDFIKKWASDFSSNSSLQLCPSPDEMTFDFDTTLPLIYVLCRQSKQVVVLETDLTRRLDLPAGEKPKKLLVGSDAQYRYVAILQSNQRIQLHRFPLDLDTFQGNLLSSLMDLPAPISDMGQFAALDEAVLISSSDHAFVFVDLETQAIRDSVYLPRKINDIAVAGQSLVHFISKEVNSAFSWEESNDHLWKLRTYAVGESPLQIERNGNLIYVIHENDTDFSIINTTNGNLATIALPNFSNGMRMNTASNQLWVYHTDNDAISEIDITGGSEALSGTTALGFSPVSIDFNSTDDTLYVAGETQVRVFDSTDLTNIIKTETGLDEIEQIKTEGTGVRLFTKGSFSSAFINRATASTRTQDKPADFFVGNNTNTFFGSFSADSSLDGANYSVLGAVDRLFSSASFVGQWKRASNEIRFFPFSGDGLSWWPVSLNIEPDFLESDANDNIWILDIDRKMFQRISPSLQPDVAQNASRNLLSDFIADPANERIYSVFEAANLLVVTNFRTQVNSFNSICDRPKQLILDTTNDRLFVLCSRSNQILAFDLDGNGDPSAVSFQGLASMPEKMALHVGASRLFVIRKHESKLDVFNSSNLSLISTLSLEPGPADLALDAPNNELHVISERSELLTSINTATLAISTEDINMRALSRVLMGEELHAFSEPLQTLYHSDSQYAASNPLTSGFWPYDISVSAAQKKVFISYPKAEALKILDEANLTEQDIDVSANIENLLVIDAETRVVASAPEDSELILINSSTHAIANRVTLPNDCSPEKMQYMTLDADSFVLVSCRRSDEIGIVDLSDNSLATPLSMRLPEL